MRTRKSYRFSPRAVEALDGLKRLCPGWTETAIIEAALEQMRDLEVFCRRYIASLETDGDQSEDVS